MLVFLLAYKVEVSNSFLFCAFVIVSAIYNASPEYVFEIIELSPNKTIFKLDGIDRYLRILSQLDIEHHITFPVLIPFMEGIKNALDLDCKIEFESVINKEENKTNTIYKFHI